MYSKKNWIQTNLHIIKNGDKYYQFIQGFFAIIDGFVRLLSFGLIWSSFEYEHCKKRLFKDNK